MSQVLFFSYTPGAISLLGLERLFTESAFVDAIPKGDAVAVKLHMGELGNIRYIRPVLARKVVDIITDKGGKPFLFDTIANYPGGRGTREHYLDTAARNGFAEGTMGAPVVIADDSDELRTIALQRRVDGCDLVDVKAPSLLLNSACTVVLSHVKGHEQTGFGGAIKNLGMGCVSRETKRAQHVATTPVFVAESDCDGCGVCADVCPTNAITMADGRPMRTPDKCIYCSTCLFDCPAHCWAWPPGAKDKLQVYVAHAASAVVSAYRGKIAFVNFIQDVVPFCDCVAPSGRPVVQDVGIAFSLDPVAIDKASLDLIDRAPIIPGSTSATPPDILGKMHKTSSMIQLETAQKLGAGVLDYELVSVQTR